MKRTLSKHQIHVISQALRIGPEGRRKGYVNRLVVDDSTPEVEVCRELVRSGLMQKLARNGTERKGALVFSVTYNGRFAIRQHLEQAARES